MDRKNWSSHRYLWLAFLMTIGLAGFGTWKHFTVKADRPLYLFAAVDRGDIVSRVVAQGTIAPVVSVDVGSQVSGRIGELYADFNSEVKKGQILARLEPDLFQADVDQASASVRTMEATLHDDRAAVASARADLEKAKVDVLDKSHKFGRQKELLDASLVSQDDYETAQAALDTAIATRKAMQAEIDSAEARVKEDEARLKQAQANLETAKLNLEHSVITSPISGTVISRNVDRGQTVAASFSAPVLFTIGQDLTRMQVNTNIDETNVGHLKIGMKAAFTADAYPGQTFLGTIKQIRLAATTLNNVVTYDALINVPNPDLALKPGMTANVRIQIDQATDALKIPNSALRFKPSLSDAQMEAVFAKIGAEDYWKLNKDTISPPPPPAAGPGAANVQPRLAPKATVSGNLPGSTVPLWILGSDHVLAPVLVKLGLTDGMNTQIAEGKLRQGDSIVIGLEFDPNRAPRSTLARPPGFGGSPMIRR